MIKKLNFNLEKGYIGTPIVQISIELIKETHLPVLTTFFYIDYNKIKNLYITYSKLLFNLNEKKNKENILNLFLFEHKLYNKLLDKSILFKDILYSVYKEEEYCNVKILSYKNVLIKDKDYLLYNILPLFYYNNVLKFTKSENKFLTNKSNLISTKKNVLYDLKEIVDYNKLILEALVYDYYFKECKKKISNDSNVSFFNQQIKKSSFMVSSLFSNLFLYEKKKKNLNMFFKKKLKLLNKNVKEEKKKLINKKNEYTNNLFFNINQLTEKELREKKLKKQLEEVEKKKLLVPYLFKFDSPKLFNVLLKKRIKKYNIKSKKKMDEIKNKIKEHKEFIFNLLKTKLNIYNFEIINEQSLVGSYRGKNTLVLSNLEKRVNKIELKKDKFFLIYSGKNLLESNSLFYSSMSRFLFDLFTYRLNKRDINFFFFNYIFFLLDFFFLYFKKKNFFFDTFFSNFFRKIYIFSYQINLNNKIIKNLVSPLDLYYLFFFNSHFFFHNKKKFSFFNIKLGNISFFYYLEKLILYLFVKNTNVSSFFSYFIFSFFSIYKKNILFNSFFNFFSLNYKINFFNFNLNSFFSQSFFFNIYNSPLIELISFFKDRYSYSVKNIIIPFINFLDIDFIGLLNIKNYFYDYGRFTLDINSVFSLLDITKKKKKNTFLFIEKKLGKKEMINLSLLEKMGENYIDSGTIMSYSENKINNFFLGNYLFKSIVNSFSFFDKFNALFYLLKKNINFYNYFSFRFLSLFSQLFNKINYVNLKNFFFNIKKIIYFFLFFRRFLFNYINFFFLFNEKINLLISKKIETSNKSYKFIVKSIIFNFSFLYNKFILNLNLPNSILNLKHFYFFNYSDFSFFFFKYIINLYYILYSNFFINSFKKIKFKFNNFVFQNNFFIINNNNFSFFLFIFFYYFFNIFNFFFYIYKNNFFYNIYNYYFSFLKKNEKYFSFINKYNSLIKLKNVFSSFLLNISLLKEKKISLLNNVGYLKFNFTKFNIFLSFLYKKKMYYFKSAGMYELNRKKRHNIEIVNEMFLPFLYKWEFFFCSFQIKIIYFYIHGPFQLINDCFLMICKRIRYHKKRYIIHQLIAYFVDVYRLKLEKRLKRIDNTTLVYNSILEELKYKSYIHNVIKKKHFYCSPKLIIPLNYPIKYKFIYGVLKKRIKRNMRGIKSKRIAKRKK